MQTIRTEVTDRVQGLPEPEFTSEAAGRPTAVEQEAEENSDLLLNVLKRMYRRDIIE